MIASCCVRVAGKGVIGEGRGVAVGSGVKVGVGAGLGEGVMVGRLVGWMIAAGVGETACVLTDVNKMMGAIISTVAIHIVSTIMVAGFDRESALFFLPCD